MTRIWSLKFNSLMSIFSLKPRTFLTATLGWLRLPSRKAFLEIRVKRITLSKVRHLQQSRMMQIRASSLIALGEPPFKVSPTLASSSEISPLGSPSRISQIRSSTGICSPAFANNQRMSLTLIVLTLDPNDDIAKDLLLSDDLLFLVLLELPPHLALDFVLTVASNLIVNTFT